MKQAKWDTRQTLLQRAVDLTDETAWAEFVSYYSPYIDMLMRRFSIAPADCEDLRQEVLLKLWRQLAQYDSSRASFRTWLSGVTRLTLLKFFEREGRRRQREQKAVADFCEQLQQSEIEQQFEEEWKSYLSELALQACRQAFSGQAVRAFEMSLQEIPTEQICVELELNRDSLYVLKSRVKKKFMLELKRLVRELEL